MIGWRRHTLLLVLVAVSVAGSVALLACGGNARLVTLLGVLDQHHAVLLVAFTGWALIANCLVLPAGSISLIAGAALLGAPLPAAIWYGAQMITAPLVYRAGVGERAQAAMLATRYLGRSAQRLLHDAAAEGVATTVVLRLTPVLPSAVAALIAAAGGIALKSFLIGSAIGGWIRPLYFASIGAAIGSLARLGDMKHLLSLSALWPLVVACGLAVALLAVRLWLRQRAVKVEAGAPVG